MAAGGRIPGEMVLQAEPARPHDLPAALDLLRRSELAQHGVAERWGHYFVVREDDGRVVAVAGLEVHGEDGLLRSVAVDPDYRGQGLAAALVAAVFERARILELKTVYLLTTTARDYFARHGFTACQREDAPSPIRESWEFRNGCPATATFMSRPVA
jgi:amino-acid N-acetyltransferase